MSRKLTASDRKNLIRLASEMPKGSDERKAILAGLASLKKTSGFGREEEQGLRLLLREFFNTSQGSPSDVSSRDKAQLKRLIGELVAEGVSMEDDVIEAIAHGDDYSFELATGIDVPEAVESISEILHNYWDA